MFTRFVALVTVLSFSVSISAEKITLPAGTLVYGELDQEVTSKKKKFSVGDLVRAHVWRNVYVDGHVVIRAGSPIMLRISHLKKARIAGIKGDLELEAASVRAVDGTDIFLNGGYDKSGKGRKALTVSLFLLVAWPLIFIKGKQARLSSGTVFDSTTEADITIELSSESPRVLNLSSVSGLKVAVLYDDFEEADDKKDAVLPLHIKYCQGSFDNPQITKVNGMSITPIDLEVLSVESIDDCTEARVIAPLKQLAKTFRKGINTFVVQVGADEVEVVLEIEL